LSIAFSPLVTVSPLRAQDSSAPLFIITGVNTNELPLVRVTAYGANLGRPLTTLPATITEDNSEQPILESRPVEVGIQTAVLFDLSRNVLPRYNDLADAADRFRVAELSAETDWLAAFRADAESGQLQVIADWTQDHQGMANEIRLQTPDQAVATTPLFGLISSALDRFDTTVMPDNLRRTLVVFSDGSDIVSAQQVETIVRKAARLGVTVETAMIGDMRNTASLRNLEQISLETGGRLWDYSSIAKIEEIEALWRQLGAQRQQHEYTYRLTKPQPREVGVTITFPEGRQMSARSDFPAINMRPPAIEALIPPQGFELVRMADSADSPLREIVPTALPIKLDISWPDGSPRLLQRVEYEIGGRTEIQQEGPFGDYEFPIDALDSGAYTLRVTAVDELGLEGKSAPVSFTISVIRPTVAAPTETPTPTDTPTPAPVAVLDLPSLPDDSNQNADSPSVEPLMPASSAAMVFSTDLPGIGRFAYGPGADGGSAVYLGNRVVPVNLVTVSIALLPLILIAAAAVMLVRRKPQHADDPFMTAPATEIAYDATAYDSKPTMVEQTAYELTEDATEPQVMVNFISPASLIYVEGGDHLPPKLDIEGGREVRIGRKHAYCDIIIDDQRVSRLHASIVEKEDGKFYIKDEGSSGGTYVNRRKLRVNDMVELHHNDIINLNTVAYRFELNDQTAQKSQP
jgi:hypothetical protein